MGGGVSDQYIVGIWEKPKEYHEDKRKHLYNKGEHKIGNNRTEDPVPGEKLSDRNRYIDHNDRGDRAE